MAANERRRWPWIAAGCAVFGIQIYLVAGVVVDYERAVQCHDLANWHYSATTQGLQMLTATFVLAHCVTQRGNALIAAVVIFAAALVVEGVRGAKLCSLAPLLLIAAGTPNLLLGWFAVAARLRLARVWWVVPLPLLVLALLAYAWHLACL